MDSQRETFVTATRELVDTLTGVVENAEKKFSQFGAMGLMLPQMMSTRVRHMFEPTTTAYWKWLEAVGVSTRKEAEALQQSFVDDEGALKCMQDLTAVESRFRELSSKMNAGVQKEEDKVRAKLF